MEWRMLRTVNCWKASNAPFCLFDRFRGQTGIKRPRLAFFPSFGGDSGAKRPRSPAAGRASGTIGVNLTAAGRQRGVPSTLCSGRLAPPSASGLRRQENRRRQVAARRQENRRRQGESGRQGEPLQKILPHSGCLVAGDHASFGRISKNLSTPSESCILRSKSASSNSPSVANCH